jgi:anti-sigma factor RsiW
VSGYHVRSVRLDIVAGHDAQVVTYAGNSGVITLCSWAAHGEPAHAVRTATYRGASIMYWNDGTTEYWAVSDQHDEGLKDFVGSAHRDAI